jgi:hypothetical protein
MSAVAPVLPQVEESGVSCQGARAAPLVGVFEGPCGAASAGLPGEGFAGASWRAPVVPLGGDFEAPG